MALNKQWMAHIAMLFVGTSFGGLNVLLGKAFDFSGQGNGNHSNNHSESSHEEQFCREAAFVVYRQAGGFVLLGLSVILFEPRPWIHQQLGLKGVFFLAAQGFTGMFMGQGFFVLGLGHTNPVVAAIFQPLSPCVVVFFAVLLGMENTIPMFVVTSCIKRLTWRKALGFLVGVGGAVEMVWPSFKPSHDGNHSNHSGGAGSGTGKEGDAIGVVLLSAGVVGGAGYLLLMKKSYSYFSPLTMSALQYSVSLLCMLVAFSAPCFEWGWGTALLRPGIDSTITWVAVGYAVVVASALNYYLMVWANKHLESSTIGLYGLVQIFSTPIISYIASKTTVSPREFVGAGMVCVSLLIVNWQQRIDDRHEEEKVAVADAEKAPLLAQSQSIKFSSRRSMAGSGSSAARERAGASIQVDD